MDPGKLIPDLSRKLHNIFVQRNTVTGSLYYNMLHKVPECAMPIAIIINGANMLYGFKKYKNKWWMMSKPERESKNVLCLDNDDCIGVMIEKILKDRKITEVEYGFIAF